MAIRVAINHKTRYKYDKQVILSPHTFRLRPAVHSRTKIEAYSLKILPETHFINWQQDPFGNYQAKVVFQEPAKELAIEVEVIAELSVINPFDFFLEEYAETFPFKYDEQLKKELVPYLEIKEDGPLLKEWIKKVDPDDRRTVEFLVNLNRKLFEDIKYSIRMEPGVQTCEETLGKAIGSCRDSAWLLVQVLRHFGLAARFVSGYLVQLTSDVKSLDGPSGPEEDFTDLHAWAEVYVPGAGWIGLDATSGLFAGEGHIPLACTPDPQSAAPVTGGFTGQATTEFFFENTVKRIHEDPRVTKPFSENQWASINALGKKVDEDLKKNDVRLTMGGEPTFVSIDDMESAQWNTAADGPHKRQLASKLIKRLRDKFGPGGLLHYGQGKWYPGEPLPRWQFSCFWRKDGEPIWKNELLLADNATDYGFKDTHAKKFLEKLADILEAPREFISPGFEDVFYFLWKEGTLPVNIDPLKTKLKDPLDRKALMEHLERGLDKPIGFILPLEWSRWEQKWIFGKWHFRRGHLFLIPGNSPMGLRLPLDSLPWEKENKADPKVEQSLFEELPELGKFPDKKAIVGKSKEGGKEPDTKSKAIPEGAIVRQAICVEARAGRLHVFFPPLTHLEHYLDLIARVEDTAAALKMPVLIEGYDPPKDYRIQKLVVTPDPGVIEVNVHPVNSWEELVNNTETLYEEARLSRLGTEKFMLDGRHTGTGGGNHVTLGGKTPSDSPLLRRPDVLRSLITYWQHHPGLSYLFSSAFVGPTSQAPRVDEGRDEMLYELEIAFNQIPEEEGKVPFWLVDRLFRNLLIDITGNTHRAEFCIDKLYSPDSSTGRLGILELRAFDMPPHARMSILQMLLIRALVSWFWVKPYKKKLIRWGTELHDRFLLPHYVKQDMEEIVNDLKDAGYPFELDWFDPFFEFRFPHYGTSTFKNIQIELRMAIEPWHVLGEEMGNQGTARFVDSSLERLQVKISGLTGDRYILTCNGCRIPLRSTGTHGEYVAGIRYRAWQPPSALHPNLGVDTPLKIDVVDTWNSKSIGGCTYYVSHPGGRSYDIFPINAYEAEGRRINRFWDFGHTTGPLEVKQGSSGQSIYFEERRMVVPMDPPPLLKNPEFPYTLDLRLAKTL
ncbi:DUF2126 domain-containing protein [Flexithrix dorotheae]|uniref:transglutaminase family protein n=1 Tax=Flexithrix dorotheae TaxID=70993 RepID=UPI0003829402|nr:transglutaminase family protein [Flexithrix dorotheae]